MKSRQSGFTLVEIAIVLVIIGLLLGGILKGQELINSARVRNVADTNAGIQAAYYGFIDRFRQVPGDMNSTLATDAIGETISVGGDGNGQVNEGSWTEASALWTHLTLANFLQGNYDGTGTDAASYKNPDTAPINPFNGYMMLSRTKDYSTSVGAPAATNSTRLGLLLGDNIPVDIARELDVKIDDQKPLTGVLRFTGQAANIQTYAGVSDATELCMTAVDNNQWDIKADRQNCNLIFLY